jgi:alanyl-tRNA synthetase
MIAGYSEAGTPVVSGATVFQWRDTYGIPFETIQMALRQRGMAMDVLGYIEAALTSGNFTHATLRRDFLEAGAPAAVLARV